MEHVTNEMIYDELKSIKKELIVLENAVIPTERLSKAELEEHRQELQEALKGEKTNSRSL